MKNLYIDESGSMTTKYCRKHKYFVIAIVVPTDKNRAKRVYKRYIAKNIEEFKKIDCNNRMFSNDKFKELKGSALNKKFKSGFLDYFCRENLLEVFYIKVDNSNIRYGLYDNTARAFNFLLVKALKSYLTNGHLPKDEYFLCIDERNEKTKTRYFLDDYLKTQFICENLVDDITVRYYDSSNNALIQIADTFSNIFYDNCYSGSFEDKLIKLREDGYIKDIYLFP